MKFSEMILAEPSVFAVENRYQICVIVAAECTMWVSVGNKTYYDHSNGILRSGKYLHKVELPMQTLDTEKKYTIYLRPIVERKPYFTETKEPVSAEYTFSPIQKKEKYNIISIADAHNLVEEPVNAGTHFAEDLDMLVLCGDVPNHAGDVEFFKAIYRIAGGITCGRVPCVYARGNHDMRGIYGEQLTEYSPSNNGVSYYTFSIGEIWGIVLDCAEDKPDTNPEYGFTICCKEFREEETEFLLNEIEKGEWKNYPIKLIVVHHPFSHRICPPFDIEQDRYALWSRELKRIQPTLMISGHLHECFFEQPGQAHDTFGFPCPVACVSWVDCEKHKYICGAITIGADGSIEVGAINESKVYTPINPNSAIKC